jgi:predicted phage terminase large subunit-like protein
VHRSPAALAHVALATPALEEVRAERARRSMLGFTTFTKPDYEVNWHHRLVCSKLDALVRGEITRLMVFMPPRHGKSELVSRRLPAYALGLNPQEQVIACAHAASLSGAMNRDVQRIIDDATGRYQRTFPRTRLGGKNIRTVGTRATWLRNSEIFEVVNSRGYYKSAGIGGAIIGRGFTLGIIDDPIKNREEADSQAHRDKVWEWFQSTFYPRQERNARILLTLTRWHEDDLAGRLLKLQAADPSADAWEIVSLPGLHEAPGHKDDPRSPGDALWPGKYNKEKLQGFRSQVGSREWSAQYQCRPSPDEGGIFKREWFCYWHREVGNRQAIVLDRKDGSPPRRFLGSQLVRFLTVDVAASAKQTADYTVIACWGMTPDKDLVLLDLHRARIDGPDQLKAIRKMHARWKTAWIGVESVAYQLTLVQTLVREGLPARELRPDKDKVARAHTAAARLETGTVFFPLGADWLSDFEHELLVFPNGANDDQADVLAYAAAWVGLQALESVTIDPSQIGGATRPSLIVGAT